MSDDKDSREDSEEVQDSASKQLDSEQLDQLISLTAVQAAQRFGPIIFNAASTMALSSVMILQECAPDQNPYESVSRIKDEIITALIEGMLHARLSYAYEAKGLAAASDLLNNSLQSIVVTLSETFKKPFKITVRIEEGKKPDDSEVQRETPG